MGPDVPDALCRVLALAADLGHLTVCCRSVDGLECRQRGIYRPPVVLKLPCPLRCTSLRNCHRDARCIYLAAVVVLLAILFRDQRKTAEERALLAGELEAAREIQQRLVPASLPEVPGLRIEAAYLPATEVGGDFYQVIPQADGSNSGSTLIVVGDVSGKGLKAAMTGTLAIGALRTLAAEDLSPAALLTRLNRQIVAAQQGGFITCLCALLHADGTMLIANAGHLSPYRNGIEVACDNGLPLGIASDVEYSETVLQLAPGDQLTLLTDGVLEARVPATGELYGFERTAAVSTKSAAAIASAAQAFGQDDDITVLTLMRSVTV
jgi:serine phosphatase RsbU (regulator of sigma subunit)